MKFGDNLLRLRKERGLSQEALAEQLDTTRQAISKWENHQGYPETEKLLLLSDLFGVSVDSLLKGDAGQSAAERGFYVSWEHAEDFLTFRRSAAARTAAGVSVMVLAGVPYTLFSEYQVPSIAASCMVVIIGLALVLSVAMQGDPYQKFKGRRLVFDPVFLAELTAAGLAWRKKTLAIVVGGIVLAALAGIIGLSEAPALPVTEMQCILSACAAFGWIYAVGNLDAYDVLTRSEERMNSRWGSLL